MPKLHCRNSTQGGFTLIEMLAVLLIIAILMTVLIVNLRGGQDLVKQGNTKAYMGQIATALGEFADEHGSYPSSQLPSDVGAAPNATNLGSESLYLALCAEGAPGFATFGKANNLCNTDNDSLSKVPKGFQVPDLFELADSWGNPIVYIQAADYDREFHYISIGVKSGVEEEFSVRAQKSAKTGRYEEPTSFQLFSAGIDGIFGNEDDIANFKVK